MQISPLGLRQLKVFEGERLDVYLDSANKLTVGIGHLVQPLDHLKFGDRITPAQSMVFLLADLSDAESTVNKSVRVDLTQNQYDALVMFTYNEGSGRFRSSTLLRFLNDGNKKLAADKMLNYCYARNPKTNKLEFSKGLANRRRKERSIFLVGY